jgi:GH15 family glucan-1,4-alpha-glucosidase
LDSAERYSRFVADRIEDYALIGNGSTAALVSRSGSIDWMCVPRFDSPACFAALLGSQENGRWLISPVGDRVSVKRRYRPGTLVLETEFTTPQGSAVLVDAMDRRSWNSDVLRLVRCVHGRVLMRTELLIRFDYGTVIPWFTQEADDRWMAVAGPDRLTLCTPVHVHGQDFKTVAEFTVAAGQEIPFSLTWSRSFVAPPEIPDAKEAIERITADWITWSGRAKVAGPWQEAMLRSLITLKALTHHQTGGIVAAPTTSLPEKIGGARNWDYRLCWLRDATVTLYALMHSGFDEEAKAWREWLLRAVAGSPAQMQTVYGVAGERRLTEYEMGWLSGYEGSRPVRIGNAASEQVQLDVYGEVIDLLFQARQLGVAGMDSAWNLENALVGHIETIWDKPDAGMWEIRGEARHFTFSKVMAWVALDRAIRTAEEFGSKAPLQRWRALRERIHREVCNRGFDASMGSFVQYFGSTTLDASLLLLPAVGFLPADDPRIRGTVAAIKRSLLHDGFVMRYDTVRSVDGLKGREGAFLACSFWLADNYVLQGRHPEACDLFERILDLRNDVGLLSEEYDVLLRRQTGNFPQAFSHVALINTGHNLTSTLSPVHHRSKSSER